MIKIDGSMGEGGGQILRTSLGLSLLTGEPVQLDGIRAGRRKPGLMRQHLTAVRAAVEVGAARVEGDAIGSKALTFRPGKAQAGEYHFAVGTAGSATLVLQTVLPALVLADGPSVLTLEGGTHNPMAPPLDFLERAFLPLLARMGARVTVSLERPGFYPAGGGLFRAEIEPVEGGKLRPLSLMERGELLGRRGRALVARLPREIGERELGVLSKKLGWLEEDLAVEAYPESRGPGNMVAAELRYEQVTEMFVGFGERGVPAPTVARRVVDQVKRYLKASAPVGRYLADQLIIPLALAGEGSFRTLALSRHTSTNMEVVGRFIETPMAADVRQRDDVVIRFGSALK
jgi:RNA 3'-terminal phosphate cyclase (ATP)